MNGHLNTAINNLFYNCEAGWAIKADGNLGDVSGSDPTHTIKYNKFWPKTRTDPAGGGHIRFYANSGLNHGKNVWIEGNKFYKTSKSDREEAISITDANHSNYLNTTLKDNISSGPYWITQGVPLNRITFINNTLNAPDSDFEENSIPCNLNGDNQITLADFTLFINNYKNNEKGCGLICDLNGDCQITIADFIALLECFEENYKK